MRAWAAALAALTTLGAAPARASIDETHPLSAVVLPAEARIARGEIPHGEEVMRLRAARGEREPALVAVRSAVDGLLAARVGPLLGPKGAVLAAETIELDQVLYVPEGGGEVPDRLEPWTAPVPLTASEGLLLWVEVAVPREAVAGLYRGELQLSSGTSTRKVPIELEVLPFTLPQTPSLATSFGLGGQSGPVGPFAQAALQERVTLRVVQPPPFRVTPGEGTLVLDFHSFDRQLDLLLGQGGTLPSSIAIAVPRSVPTPRRLEYLLGVKRHLAARGCADLLINFSGAASLLRRAGGDAAVPNIELVSTHSDTRAIPHFWWDLDARGLEPGAGWLAPGTPGYRIRSIGWAAFRAGAAGLYAEDARLLFQAEDGSPRESVRLKLLRQGLEDYELLRLAWKASPVRAEAIAQSVLGDDEGLASQPVVFDGYRLALARIIEVRRQARRVQRVP